MLLNSELKMSFFVVVVLISVFPGFYWPLKLGSFGPQGFVGNSLFFEICDEGGGWLGQNWRKHGENAATTRWVPTNSQMEL